jgi:site-specific DNA-methyltransferase (adenine-specific)
MANDLIFDPMAGSGTTVLACQRMKRKFIGCEIEEKYKPIIEGRLCYNE